MDQLQAYLEHPQFQRILIIIVGTLLIMVFGGIVKSIIPRYIHNTSSRYRTRKFVGYLTYFLIVMMILLVYSEQLSGLTVFLGVAGAGIAFALQEVIASVAGFIAINFSNFYSIGDRVMLGGTKGDVIDIGVLRTSIMQIGDWVNGDLYNGKIVRIANSFIFKEPVFNYSGDFPFLWDEVTIPVQVGSDFEYARIQFLKILDEVQGEYAVDAQVYWQKMTEKFMIENAQVAPMVTLTFDENWITFTLRYVVDYKKRRATKNLIFTKSLKAIEASDGKIKIGITSIEIAKLAQQT